MWKTLHLPLKREHFEAIRKGTKTVDFRLYNSYWRKRIEEGPHFDKIELTLGYPKKDDADRRMVRLWHGYDVREITHPEFGDKPVTVFAIYL